MTKFISTQSRSKTFQNQGLKRACLSVAIGLASSASYSVWAADAPVSSQSVIIAVTENIIENNYQVLSVRLEALAKTLQALQTSPDDAGLQAAKQAWRSARVGFEVAETHLFGPVVSLEIDPKLDSWPVDLDALKRHIDKAKNLKKAEMAVFLATLPDEVTGYHAVEYILFGENNAKKASQLTVPEITYAQLLVKNMITASQSLNTAWQKGYAAQFTRKAPSDNFASDDAVVQELVVGMINIVDEVGTGKLIDPLGDSIATANPALAESRFSWNSAEDFFWNIVGVKQVWGGQSYLTNKKGKGLQDLVAEKNPELAKKVSQQIDDVISDIVQISYSAYEEGAGGPIKEKGNISALLKMIDQSSEGLAFKSQVTSNSGRKKIQTAEASLDALKYTLEKEVLPLLVKKS